MSLLRKAFIACGVGFAFRCCKIVIYFIGFNVLFPFCSMQIGLFFALFYLRKVFFIMKLTLKKLCVLSLFTAITVILSVYCTLRIGNAIKIPFKFISVFLTAAIFGPLWGGTVAAIGDILNVFLAPSGAFIPAITLVEFFYGFVFGIFFYNKSFKGKGYYIRAFLCTIVLLLTDLFITSFILTKVGYFPSFSASFTLRLPAGIIKAVIYVVFIAISSGYIGKFKALSER